MLVVSLGDLVLDVIVRLRQPLARGADASSDVTLATGGQGANVAAWVATLGGRSRWVGKRADDIPGRIAAARLIDLGVELAGPVERGRNGVIVSIVDPDGGRTMCPDRGVAVDLSPDELEDGWFACDHLHVSGYALLAEPVRAAAVEAVAAARRHGARVSIDLSSWSSIRDTGPAEFRSLLVELAPDLVFANEDEDEIVGGAFPGPSWILKRGAEGCSFAGAWHPVRPVPVVVDSTGAGDALAAGLIVGGPELALEAAARCVGRAGSMP